MIWFVSSLNALSSPDVHILSQMKKLAAVGYIGQAPDVASLVSYLASKEGHYITGVYMIYFTLPTAQIWH